MSDKPLAQRLQVKPGRTLAVLDAPQGFAVKNAPSASLDQADVVLAFTPDRSRLEAVMTDCASSARPDAIFWVAYPKLTSALKADLSRDIIHALSPALGWDAVAQIAVDADWSAMRFKRV